MSEISSVLELLGEDNVKRFKDKVVDILLERVRDDLDSWGRYILYPPNVSANVDEACRATEKKIAKMYKDAMIDINQSYINDMKKMMLSNGHDSALRRAIVDLAETYSHMGNEYSKEYKFAQELKNILRATQNELLNDEGEIK